MSRVEFTTDEYGREWRFATVVNPHDPTDVTILRGRKYQLPSDSDHWTWYFDGDTHVAFYDEGFRGIRACTEDDDDLHRAIMAHKMEKAGGKNSTGALDKVAQRITGQPESRFIRVPLDRGTDLYLLAWGGDPDGELRREVEAVWNGDIWRIEVEQFKGFDMRNDPSWYPDDEVCEEWYGEDKADEGWVQHFPLAAFPAELLTALAGA